MHTPLKQYMAHAGRKAGKQEHAVTAKKQPPATSEEQKAVWANICKHLTIKEWARAAGTGQHGLCGVSSFFLRHALTSRAQKR